MTAVVTVPMTFAATNRPVYVVPFASMRFAEMETALPQMLIAVRGLMRLYPTKRILVHTVSYDLAKYLTANLTDADISPRIVTYESARDRENAISTYRANDKSVLIASSLDRGVDFRHDDCRVVAVCKMPYPNLNDKQVNARLYEPGGRGKHWYAKQTVRTLIQMTGRGVRSVDDHCDNYIFDAKFLDLFRSNEHLFYQWWKDAVDMSANKKKTLRTLGGIRKETHE